MVPATMRDGIARRSLKAVALFNYTVNLRVTRFLGRLKGPPPFELGGECRCSAHCCEAPSVQLSRIAGEWRDVEEHEGVGGERTCEHAWLVNVDRVRRHLVECVVDANQCLGHVGAEREVQFDLGRATRSGCFETLQVRHGAQVLFLLDENFFLDVLGRRAGPRSHNRNRANVEVGNHLHRDAQRRDDTEHGENQCANSYQKPVGDERPEKTLVV